MTFKDLLDGLVSPDKERIVKFGPGPVWDYKVQNDQLQLIHGHNGEWHGEKPVLFEELLDYVEGLVEPADMGTLTIVDEETNQEVKSFEESGTFITFKL